MASSGPTFVQRIEITHKASNINAVSWSEDNRIVLVTTSFISVINISGTQTEEKKHDKRLMFKKSAIPVENKLPDSNVDYDFSLVRMTPFSVNPFYSTAVIDPALCPTILRISGFEDVCNAKWSPVGCDRTGRSVLAVLFRTNKLLLYIADKQSLHGWYEIIDLNTRHTDEIKNGNFFTDKDSLKGKHPQDKRRFLGKKEDWKEFNEWQRRKYLINFTCIEWYPATVCCAQKKTNTMCKFAFLATIVKGGQLFIWQAQLPLVRNHSFMYRAVAAYTSMSYPSCLAWYGTTEGKVSYLGCGSSDGVVKVFLLHILSTNHGLPEINIVKAYNFTDSSDGIPIDCMAWYYRDQKMYLACSHGQHVSLYHTHVMKEGLLSKPVKQVITGVHLLNITGLTISPNGILYSTSSEGTVQQFEIGSHNHSTAVDCETLAGHGYSGISLSPNGVFMALYETKRKLFHHKKGAFATGGQLVILSLISNKENVSQLMSMATSVVDMVNIRDRFLHRELFEADVDNVTLPSNFRGFSKAYLQFLWNLFASDPKYNKDVECESLQLELPHAAFDEEQSICWIKKIEDEVACLAMQNALNFILDYNEGVPKDYNDPLFGDVTVKAICYWLAERKPSPSVVDLLRKVWNICKSGSQHVPLGIYRYTNVCDEILANNVAESCMCGQPITLTKVRYGRCQSGHVWPRCCVTFKLLDGTNARICENCNAHALNRYPINSPYEDWTKHLLDVTSSCTYCGAWFEEA